LTPTAHGTFFQCVATPRYIYASTARRRRLSYPLIAGGAILLAVLAEVAAAAF
jgi:hypothetical protein